MFTFARVLVGIAALNTIRCTLILAVPPFRTPAASLKIEANFAIASATVPVRATAQILMISLVKVAAVRAFLAILALVTAILAVFRRRRTWAYEANVVFAFRIARATGAATQVIMVSLVEGTAVSVFRAVLELVTARLAVLRHS